MYRCFLKRRKGKRMLKLVLRQVIYVMKTPMNLVVVKALNILGGNNLLWYVGTGIYIYRTNIEVVSFLNLKDSLV